MGAVEARERLIVSLDVSTDAEAWSIIRQLDGLVEWFKISHQLWSAAGPELLETMRKENKRVFLDFKYHDIYESVKSAVASIAARVSFLTLHGNGETIRGARAGRGQHPVKLLAFTALSSFDADDLKDIYNWDGTVEKFMVENALHAREKGVDGVIASGPQIAAVRRACPPPFLIVTPGVRLAGESVHDHKRPTTPFEAIEAGSDYLVVGRPITQANNPAEVALEYLREMQEAFNAR